MAFDGLYYKIYEFTGLTFQKDAGGGTITDVAFRWPNKLTPAQETVTYEWNGGGSKYRLTSLQAMSWTLDLDAADLLRHQTLFGTAEITAYTGTTLDISTMVPFGTLSDAAGAAVGMYATANALAGDAQTPVTLAIWAPLCTVTLTALPGLTSGAIADKMQYSITASRAEEDIAGNTITGAPTGGAFVYLAETA
jgi:hypothetical protein